MGACCCCGTPPPHFEHAPEPGIKQQGRKCHDVLFLLLFIAFWVGMIYVASAAVKQGDPKRLIYGVGYDGNVCGETNAKLYEQFPDKARDLTHLPFLYFLPGSNGTSYLGICVSKCPEETYRDPVTVDEILCPYNITPSMDLVAPKGPCWGTYATSAVFFRCLPKVVNVSDDIISEIEQIFSLQQVESTARKVLGNIINNWRYLVGAAAVALALSFFWLMLLRYFAGFIVWATILLVIFAIGVLAYLVRNSIQNREAIYDGLPPYARLVSDAEVIKVLSAVFYILLILDGIIILVVLCMINRIAIAIGVIKEASKAVIHIPTILLVPIVVAVVFIAPLAAYWIYIGAYLSTAGAAQFDDAGVFLGYNQDRALVYMLLYHLLGGYWTLNFFHAICECVIAGSIACWYWVHDKHNMPASPVLKSVGLVVRYHLGSLLFGSLILALVQFIRFLLQRLENAIKGKETQMVRFFFKCAQCILSCFERFIKFLNKNAYIMIAIYGYSFCQGARRGFDLISSNILRVSALNCVSGFLIFLGKLLVCIITTLAAFVLLDDIVTVIVIAIIAYAISVAFFSVFDMAVDTILLCFCEDSERNDGSAERPYFMSSSLKSHVSTDHGCGLCCCC